METFVHEFKGFGRVPSRCLVKIISENDKHFILFEDINEGTSVTNASEQLASEIVSLMGYEPEDCKFFETYKQYDYDTFDEIIYEWSFDEYTWEASKPNWMPGHEDIKHLFKL